MGLPTEPFSVGSQSERPGSARPAAGELWSVLISGSCAFGGMASKVSPGGPRMRQASLPTETCRWDIKTDGKQPGRSPSLLALCL